LIQAFERVMERNEFYDLDIEMAITSWEMNEGIPVVTIAYDGDGYFDVYQRRFTDGYLYYETKWFLPVNFAHIGNLDFENVTNSGYLTSEDELKKIDAGDYINYLDGGTLRWLMSNKQRIGYYRVDYELTIWNVLYNMMDSNTHRQIHMFNRIQIIDDVLIFARKSLSFTVAFRILRYLNRETEFQPFAAAEPFFNELYSVWGPLDADLNVSCLQ